MPVCAWLVAYLCPLATSVLLSDFMISGRMRACTYGAISSLFVDCMAASTPLLLYTQHRRAFICIPLNCQNPYLHEENNCPTVFLPSHNSTRLSTAEGGQDKIGKLIQTHTLTKFTFPGSMPSTSFACTNSPHATTGQCLKMGVKLTLQLDKSPVTPTTSHASHPCKRSCHL